MKIFLLFFFALLIGLFIVSANDDYFCFTKLSNNENIPSIVNSISDKLICANGLCTCRLSSGEGYCLVCTNSSGWFSAYNECNSDYCDPTEVINGELNQFVQFPLNNDNTITKQRFYVEINTTRKSKIDLIDMVSNERKNLCMHCNYFKKMIFFDEGFNDIVIKSAVAGEVQEKRISFFIDTKKPRIMKTLPSQNKFANGEFKVFYEENNIQKVELFYGEKDNINVKGLDCENGKNECFIQIDLSSYNGNDIYYWFNIVDIAGSSVNSSKLKIKVDNKKPVINSLDYDFINGMYNVILNISDDNFYRVVYFDSGKEKLFCSSLRNSVCSRRLKIVDGLRINVIDRAGNFEERDLF